MGKEEKKHAKKEPKKMTKLAIFTRIWSFLFLAASVGFIGILVYADLFPFKYLMIAGVVIGIIALLLFFMLFLRNVKKSRKIVALILSVVLIAAYIFPALYLNGTIKFVSTISNTGEHMQTESFYVVVLKDSTYQELKDIQGKNVATYDSQDEAYDKAQKKLKDKEDIQLTKLDDLSKIATGLTEDKKYEAILVSSSHYDVMGEEHDGFKDTTKILYTIKVKTKVQDISKDVDVTKEPFNIYVSGLDVQGNIGVTSRSDVNMIVTINPKTHQILLTSIPRDYAINLPSKDGAYDKLTHTGIYGINETVGAVEKMMGIDINYYVKVNYTTVTTLVDAIGGIDVNSDFAFTTHGQQVYYSFVQGNNHLDGAQALAFARERKSFEDGDVQRVKDQQKIVEAVIKKAASSKTLLTKYSDILSSLEGYVETNLSEDQIKSLVKMQVSDMKGWTITKENLTGKGTTTQCYSTGTFNVYVMDQDKEKIAEALDAITGVMNGNEKDEEQ